MSLHPLKPILMIRNYLLQLSHYPLDSLLGQPCWGQLLARCAALVYREPLIPVLLYFAVDPAQVLEHLPSLLPRGPVSLLVPLEHSLLCVFYQIEERLKSALDLLVGLSEGKAEVLQPLLAVVRERFDLGAKVSLDDEVREVEVGS